MNKNSGKFEPDFLTAEMLLQPIANCVFKSPGFSRALIRNCTEPMCLLPLQNVTYYLSGY